MGWNELKEESMEIIAYISMFIDHIVKFLAPNYYSTNPILR